MFTIIYLDHASTTPLHPDVKRKMMPYLENIFGNPSSIHSWGRDARAAIDNARVQVAKAINATVDEIVFTSGGTEANNLAIMGAAFSRAQKGQKHIITSQAEHYAVLKTCTALENMGYSITYLPVDKEGMIYLTDLRESITKETALISIMYGNNEVGSIQPVEEIGKIAHEHNVLFHTDAIQALGVEEIDVQKSYVDLLSLSAHKVNGPKGVGALYVKKGVRLAPLIHGGVQERNLRAGTENVAAIVGMGEAVSLAKKNLSSHRESLLALRSFFISQLDEHNVLYEINGSQREFLPHILNISFIGIDSTILLINLDMEGIACSSGSTCTSGIAGVSHVLEAMGVSPSRCASAIRFSFGVGNSMDEMSVVAGAIADIVHKLKK